jgi:hypothetical protein
MAAEISTMRTGNGATRKEIVSIEQSGTRSSKQLSDRIPQFAKDYNVALDLATPAEERSEHLAFRRPTQWPECGDGVSNAHSDPPIGVVQARGDGVHQ